MIHRLTLLAYRYEGLRRSDFEDDIISLLRSNFEKEVGPMPLRKSSLLYEQWVKAAGGVIKGRAQPHEQATLSIAMRVHCTLLRSTVPCSALPHHAAAGVG